MNTLFVIIGCSGSGKTSLMRRITNQEIISVTTRNKRPGEKNGVDYYFLTDSQYELLEKGNHFLEKNIYDNAKYGITKDELNYKLSKNDCFCIVDIYGLNQLRKIDDLKIVSIFIYSDINSVKERMIKRGNTQGEVKRRLTKYRSEIQDRYSCDYVIKNKDGKMRNTEKLIREIMKIEGTNLKLKRRLWW